MSLAIETRQIRKAYKAQPVLKGIDLAVNEGDIFCLLGSNGAGKTTMVRILSTLLKADEGEAALCGYSLRRQPESVRSVISLTGQYAAVDASLTGLENLTLVGKLLRVKRPKERAMELLREYRLQDVVDKKAKEYSGGMRRRLDIAMSLVRMPRILFLDEPTTGLDPQSRLEMWQVVRQLKQAGVTVFLTTQYLEEADQLADRIAVLHQGDIIAQGTAKDIKAIAPYGSLTLRFHDETGRTQALARLEGQQPAGMDDPLALTLPTDGSMDRLNAVLELLRGIDVATLEQRQATLEEAFLHLIDQPKGGSTHAAQ